jgi:hypothetical protein
MPPDPSGPDLPDDFDFVRIAEALRRHEVEYVVVGGMADTLHGSDYSTQDADILVKVDPENLSRLRSALLELDARPTPEAEVILANPEEFVTDAGLVDVFDHVAGAGRYEDVLPTVELADVDGNEIPHLDLMTLIKTREAAHRPVDEIRLEHLRLIAQELGISERQPEAEPEKTVDELVAEMEADRGIEDLVADADVDRDSERDMER